MISDSRDGVAQSFFFPHVNHRTARGSGGSWCDRISRESGWVFWRNAWHLRLRASVYRTRQITRSPRKPAPDFFCEAEIARRKRKNSLTDGAARCCAACIIKNLPHSLLACWVCCRSRGSSGVLGTDDRPVWEWRERGRDANACFFFSGRFLDVIEINSVPEGREVGFQRH